MDLIQIGIPPEEELGGGAEIDPVCGMRVEPTGAAGEWEYEGKTYYFCTRSCLEKFRAGPKEYLGTKSAGLSRLTPAARQMTVPTRHATYTCPMHPEVVREGPGTCP